MTAIILPMIWEWKIATDCFISGAVLEINYVSLRTQNTDLRSCNIP